MAVISVSEHYQNRSGSVKLEKYQQRYTRTFLVRCNSILDDAVTVINGCGITLLTSTYPSAPACVCTSLDAKQDNKSQEGTVWTVTATYESEYDLSKVGEDPTARDVVVSLQFEKSKEQVITDLNGDDIVNSAGDPFDAPIERDTSRHRWNLTKNFAYDSFDLNWIDALRDTHNDAEWWLYQAGECKMDGITASVETENDVKFWKVQFNILVDKINTWDVTQVYDRGFRTYDEDTGQTLELLDDRGAPRSKPAFLDGAGAELPDGDPPVLLDFAIYPGADWSDVPYPV